jgi:aminoglycoside phosphotransferase (APT) family kinase protein
MTASTIDSETIEIREMHRFDQGALVAYMKEHVAGFTGDLEIKQFIGGQSNPTFMMDDGKRGYVMRKKPPGDLLPSAHQVDREYKVMKALANTDVPVPEMYMLCDDESIIGTKFFIMEKVEGRVLRDPLLSELANAGERQAYFKDFYRVMAAMHNVDIDAVGLGEFGRKGQYIERQISRWSKQYIASATEDIPAMNRIMAWLPENVPADDSVSIVHGDYRAENTITMADQPKIAAVLDWELSTIGHPLSDLAYCCVAYHGDVNSGGSSYFGNDLEALGIPTEEEVIAQYCQLTGRDGIDDWYFYIVFSLFRMAAIIQGVYKRGLDGNAASTRALEFGDICRERAEAAWRMVEENR